MNSATLPSFWDNYRTSIATPELRQENLTVFGLNIHFIRHYGLNVLIEKKVSGL